MYERHGHIPVDKVVKFKPGDLISLGASAYLWESLDRRGHDRQLTSFNSDDRGVVLCMRQTGNKIRVMLLVNFDHRRDIYDSARRASSTIIIIGSHLLTINKYIITTQC